MDSLIPVLGTLAGALIGGGVSLLAQRLTARYAHETQIRNMAEERARWAAEKKLHELQKLYGQVADFLDATGELRRAQARQTYLADDVEFSKDASRDEYNSARARWEPALSALLDDILIFDTQVYDAFRETMAPRQDWFFSKTQKEGLQHLMTLEKNLTEFSRTIAERYRQIFRS